MQILLKLPAPFCIYREPLDRLNLIYTVKLIRKSVFKDLIFIISIVGAIYNIPKTIIFINPLMRLFK